MSATVETPIKTPKQSNDCNMSTPLFVPPTPLLKELGYGTGKFIYTELLFEKHFSQCKINRFLGKKCQVFISIVSKDRPSLEKLVLHGL